jgi:hypothetical protein
MTFDDGLRTYLGTKSKAGFNNRAHPGTLSNINGGTGTWYCREAPVAPTLPRARRIGAKATDCLA